MTNITMKYPSLYQVADKASLCAQTFLLRLTVLHALLLIIGTTLAINIQPQREYSLIMAIFYLAAVALSVFLGVKKYEKTWYNGRAVAESIKTSTWRYTMRAVPFEDAESVQAPRAEFRNMLESIIRTNRELGDSISEHEDTGEQVTVEMNNIRALSLDDRKKYYLSNRIDEQRKWYATKAVYNRKMQKRWFFALIVSQSLAVVCALTRIAYPDWAYWPTDTLVLIASFCIAWMQLKKFNELSSSYSLTAQEIGVLRGHIESVTNENQLSEFVNSSELAFSREHTQWVARQET